MSVDLVMQHAKRMLRIMLSYVGCLDLPYFSTLDHKGHDFLGEKNVSESGMSVLNFLTILSARLLIVRRTTARYY